MCARCGGKRNRSGQRYCRACHNAYMRKYREKKGYSYKHLPESDQQKIRARHHAGTALRRGQILRSSCEECGNKKAEMHHNDYSKALEVIWLCRKCHLAKHRLAA